MEESLIIDGSLNPVSSLSLLKKGSEAAISFSPLPHCLPSPLLFSPIPISPHVLHYRFLPLSFSVFPLLRPTYSLEGWRPRPKPKRSPSGCARVTSCSLCQGLPIKKMPGGDGTQQEVSDMRCDGEIDSHETDVRIPSIALCHSIHPPKRAIS